MAVTPKRGNPALSMVAGGPDRRDRAGDARPLVGKELREAPLARRYTLSMESVPLFLVTAIWTAVWAAALPKLSKRVELVAGLIPFAAFGLRVC